MKKIEELEKMIEYLSENFFTIKIWQRKDVSTIIAQKRIGITRSKVYRLLKGMKIDYQNEPFSEGMTTTEKVEYLKKNLKIWEFIEFYKWYEEIKNIKAPSKKTYNLSYENLVKSRKKYLEKKKRNIELMKSMNALSSLDSSESFEDEYGIDKNVIEKNEREKLLKLNLVDFTKEIANEVYKVSTTEKQKARFVDRYLSSREQTISFILQNRVNTNLKRIAIKVYLYRKANLKKISKQRQNNLFVQEYIKIAKISEDTLKKLANI